MARRASRAAQGRALGAALLAVAAAAGACGGGGPQPGAVVTVSVAMPGASAAEAETQLLEPIEQAVSQVKGVHGLRGHATEGGAAVDVTFRRGVDVLGAKQALQAALSSVSAALPTAAEVPYLAERPRAWVLARVGDQPQLYDRVRAEIERAPVARVEQCGVREARIVADVVPVKLAQFGLTLADIARTFREASLGIPAGRIDADASNLQLRVVNRPTSYDQIADTVVGVVGGGATVKLRDVAVLTQRSEATCLVELASGGAIDAKLPALMRVGIRAPEDRALVEKELTKLGLVALKDAATFTTPGRPTRVTLVAAPIGPVVEAVLTGDDAAALGEAGRKALAGLREAPGVAAAWCRGCELAPGQRMEIDRAAAAERQIRVETVAHTLRAALVGERVATFLERDLEMDVVVAVEEGETRWGELPIRSEDGKVHRLDEVVKVTATTSPRDLLHVDRRRAVAVVVRGHAKTPAAALQKLLAAALPGTRPHTVDARLVDGETW
ncbi:MAG TPA: efflux RND transporter permease subunit [Kofleriaceae bacterium]|nr:efflux RND transporter permease subunit [Kofleriaceae bacterium]